jgi:hypothetical protein
LALILAIVASLVVLAAAPAIGQIRGAVQEALPGYYRPLLAGVVLLAVGAGVVAAAVRIRSDRGLRYGLIGLAIATGAIYSLAMATGNANVDAVERFHFVEYGLLTLLFHRAFADRGRGSSLQMAFMAVFLVGTLDEGIQWFVPERVGEWRDVLLNSVAIACGLMFGLGLEEVRLKADTTYAGDVRSVRHQADRKAPAALTAVAGIAFATFFSVVHIGHEIRDPAIGSFRSRYSAGELEAMAADRARRWQVEPPLTLHRYSREDQYLAEALWHIQRRNEMEGEGGVWATWYENLILEKYFAPVLDHPTYRTPEGGRWPAEQRANVEAAVAGTGQRPFVSDAAPFPIYSWFEGGAP